MDKDGAMMSFQICTPLNNVTEIQKEEMRVHISDTVKQQRIAQATAARLEN